MAKLGPSLGCDLQISPGDLSYNSATQGANLGALATTGDGRYFRHVLAGASNLPQGKLCSASAEVTGLEDLDIAAAAVGDTTITTTSTVTVTANQFAGGYIVVTNGTGAGYTYQIKSHPAATAAVVTFTLVDAVQATTASTVDIDVVASPYSGVVLWTTSQVAEAVGVAVVPITANQYGWLQVKGPVGVLCDAGNLTIGQMAVASDDTDGAVGPFESDALAFPVVGIAMTGISSAEYGLVHLNLP